MEARLAREESAQQIHIQRGHSLEDYFLGVSLLYLAKEELYYLKNFGRNFLILFQLN